MADAPGAQMPGADPFELLENSHEVQNDLHLTEQQVSRIGIAARHFRTKLQELSYPRPGVCPAAARAEIQHHVMDTRGTIARELTPPQLARLQQIMLQLEGPCLAVIDPQAGQQLAITGEQARALNEACQKRAAEMRQAFQPANSKETFCAVMLGNRNRVEQVRVQADQKIVGLLSPEQQGLFKQMAGRELSLQPPIPPECL